MKITASVYLYAISALVCVGLIVLAVTSDNTPSPLTPLAQCLTKNGAKMYGAWWCPHCESQKQLFGNAFSAVNYVECSPNRTKEIFQTCKDDGITGFPTWRFSDGTELGGQQTAQALADKTNCQDALPK